MIDFAVFLFGSLEHVKLGLPRRDIDLLKWNRGIFGFWERIEVASEDLGAVLEEEP